MRLAVLFPSLLLITVVAVIAPACSSDPDTTPTEGNDAGNGVAADDSGSNNTTPDDDDAAPSGNTDSGSSSDAPVATKATSVNATINNVSRTLSRAQFGTSADDAGQSTFYIEAHEGGQPECPNENTPSPMRTMIVSNIPRGGALGTTYTKDKDGIAVSFLDFTGDQLTDKPVTKATAATVTLVAIDELASVEIQVDATFPEGTATGRIYATFCDSLSD